MNEKQLKTLVGGAFLLVIGIVIAFAVADAAKGKISNPIEKALQGQQQPKK